MHCSNCLQSLAPNLVRFLMLLSTWHLPRHQCYPCLILRCPKLRRCRLSCSRTRHLAILQGAASAPRDRQKSWRGFPLAAVLLVPMLLTAGLSCGPAAFPPALSQRIAPEALKTGGGAVAPALDLRWAQSLTACQA